MRPRRGSRAGGGRAGQGQLGGRDRSRAKSAYQGDRPAYRARRAAGEGAYPGLKTGSRITGSAASGMVSKGWERGRSPGGFCLYCSGCFAASGLGRRRPRARRSLLQQREGPFVPSSRPFVIDRPSLRSIRGMIPSSVYAGGLPD